MPALIGTHWFQWMDEPNTGRMDGENYNIGLIDIADRPYSEFCGSPRRQTHKRLYAVHAGGAEAVRYARGQTVDSDRASAAAMWLGAIADRRRAGTSTMRSGFCY